MVLRDRNTLKPLDRNNVHSFIVNCVEPLTFNEAIIGHYMNDELMSLNKNETCILVNLRSDKVALRNAWVYKTKYKTDGNLDKFKVRLVFKVVHRNMVYIIMKHFQPVVRYEPTRAIFAVSAVEKLKLQQFDIKTACLYEDLNLYMIQLTGYEDGSN